MYMLRNMPYGITLWNDNVARILVLLADNHFQQRGLAVAVTAHKTYPFARIHVKTHIVKNLLQTERL